MNLLRLALLGAVLGRLAHAEPNRAVDELLLPRTSEHDYDTPSPGTYTLPVIKSAGDGAVLGSDGGALRLRELTRGRVTVLSFIYTRCASAKACPYATGVLNQLHRLSQKDRSLAKDLRLVSLSFDPANDTPERMSAYSAWAGGREGAAEWRFITTRSQTELRPILEAYGQAVDRKSNPNDPTGPLNHTLRVYLIDREGRIRNIYSSGTLDARLVLADVRTLLMEEGGGIGGQHRSSAASSDRILSPVEAMRHEGEVRTVGFHAATAVTVREIVSKQNEKFTELLLVDALNDDVQATPMERARFVARFPAAHLQEFGIDRPSDLVHQFRDKWVQVTGKVAVEPEPMANDSTGREGQSRASITVTNAAQVRIVERP